MTIDSIAEELSKCKRMEELEKDLDAFEEASRSDKYGPAYRAYRYCSTTVPHPSMVENHVPTEGLKNGPKE